MFMPPTSCTMTSRDPGYCYAGRKSVRTLVICACTVCVCVCVCGYAMRFRSCICARTEYVCGCAMHFLSYVFVLSMCVDVSCSCHTLMVNTCILLLYMFVGCVAADKCRFSFTGSGEK